MPNEFAITASTDRVTLDAERRGRATFTVSNMTDRPLRARARVVPFNDQAASWFVIGEPERDIPVAETQQYTVDIAVPATAPPGDYTIRIDVVGVENPDEQYAQGPGMVVVVPAAPEPEAKPFPWWIVIAGGALVLLVALVAVVLALLDDGDDNGGVRTGITAVEGGQTTPGDEIIVPPGGNGADTVAEGNIVLTGVVFLDLDGAIEQPGGSVSPNLDAERDVRVGSQNIEQSMLEPVNGALIGRAGASEPGASGCAALNLGSGPIPADQISAGDHYCIRTTDGNLSQLRVDEFGIGTGGFLFQIEVTWLTFAG